MYNLNAIVDIAIALNESALDTLVGYAPFDNLIAKANVMKPIADGGKSYILRNCLYSDWEALGAMTYKMANHEYQFTMKGLDPKNPLFLTTGSLQNTDIAVRLDIKF